MSRSLIRIAVTGGAGQIAYSLLFRIAAGELFPNQPIALHILEVPEMIAQLEGVKMELQDAAFPLLQEIHIGSDPLKLFEGVNWAFLVGAKPRGPGMERKDLLLENANTRLFRARNDSDFNYQFIADAFSSNDTTTSSGKNPFLKIGTIHLKNVRFTYRDEPSVDVTVHLPEFTAEFNKLSLDKPLLDLNKIQLDKNQLG